MPTQRKNKRNSRRNSQKKNLQKRKSQRGGRRENKQRENKQRRNRSRRNSQKGGEGLLDIFGSKGNEITFTNGNNQVVNGTYKKGSKVFGIGTDDTFKFNDPPELKDKEYKVVVDETGTTIKFSDKTDTGNTGIVIDENVSYMFTKKPATTAAAAPAAPTTDATTTDAATTPGAAPAPAPRGPNLLTRQPGNKKLINDDLKLEDVEDVEALNK